MWIKKLLLFSIGLLLVGTSVAQTEKDFELNLNLETTKPKCLPQKWSPLFSGTAYTVFSHNDYGMVISWNCPTGLVAPQPTHSRYAFVVTREYLLNPSCSTMGIDAFRKAETSAVTTFFNMLKACGRKPDLGTSEVDNYVRLLTIGLMQPEAQEWSAQLWFGENYRPKVPPPR